jgi:hypothetical protein
MSISARVQLDLNILRKSSALLNAPNLHDAPDYRGVCERAPGIFAASDV